MSVAHNGNEKIRCQNVRCQNKYVYAKMHFFGYEDSFFTMQRSLHCHKRGGPMQAMRALPSRGRVEARQPQSGAAEMRPSLHCLLQEGVLWGRGDHSGRVATYSVVNMHVRSQLRF